MSASKIGRVLALGWCVAGILISLPAVARAQPVQAEEYHIKAVFLFNFVSFAEWPPAAFATPQSPIVIGVLGDDPFGSVLDEITAGERINDRPLVVRRFRSVAEAAGCHILFISDTEERQLPAILASCRGLPMLTVSDLRGFAEAGGMIAFVNERNRIRLRINQAAADAAHVALSSKLLRTARIVGNAGGAP